MRKPVSLLALSAVAILLGGCGIKGPLYMPPQAFSAAPHPLLPLESDHSNKIVCQSAALPLNPA